MYHALKVAVIWGTEAASILPGAAVATLGATLTLVGLLYLGCIPAATAELTVAEECWARVGGLLVLWAAL